MFRKFAITVRANNSRSTTAASTRSRNISLGGGKSRSKLSQLLLRIGMVRGISKLLLRRGMGRQMSELRGMVRGMLKLLLRRGMG